jgi:sterol desaturase/sphingolipid hydroxylase (fatty acid hydroxylase superfamily)
VRVELALKSFLWQIWGLLFGLKSTLSVWAVGMTLALAVCFVIAAKQRARPIRLRVILRVLFPRRIWRTKSGWSDIGWFGFSVLLFAPLFGWAYLSAEAAANMLHQRMGDASLFEAPRWLALPLASIAMFVGFEFSYWFGHMIKHKVPFLWAFHRVHHVPAALTPITGFRVHPVDTLILYYVMIPVVGLIGGLLPSVLGPQAAPVALGGLNLLTYLTTVFIVHIQHSHFWVTLGPKWGQHILGPAHHQLHHSSNPAHFNSNYGNCIAVFDRLFGSFKMPDVKRGALQFGMSENDVNPHGIWATAFLPFVRAFQSLRPANKKRALV